MAMKRKHVVFAEDGADPDQSISSSGPYVHPSRVGAPALAPPAEKKPKSAKKLRYLAAKNRRHRKLQSAKKASAPKSKQALVDQTINKDSSDVLVETPVPSGSVEERLEDEAGPSSAGLDFLDEHTLVAAVAIHKKSKKDVKRKGKEQANGSVESLAAGEGEEVIVPGGFNDEVAAVEKRRKEKREKREARKLKKSKEEKKAASKPNVPPAAGPLVPEENNLVEEDSGTPELDGRSMSPEDELDRISPSPSPPPLEAFPLPTPAPAPDPKLLSRQGLPSGLDKATFIDQNLRMGVDDIKVTKIGQWDQGPQGISEGLKGRLSDLGIKEFFAVQAAMLPELLPLPLVPVPQDGLCDYLISAPTGSGKTLAYAIPIIEILATRFVKRVRALIVLPTRDLVIQVRETLETLARGTGLTIAAVTGAHSFKHEQHQIVEDMESKLLGGSSKIDILIATPGRLIDHLMKTPNFTLQHLRFLIIDEADRLLNQSFQNWLALVLAHINSPTKPVETDFKRIPNDRVAPAWMDALGLAKRDWEGATPIPVMCQKLLFSATLTRDPAKVASLALNNPKYYIVQSSSAEASATAIGEQFAVPDELKEKMVVLDPVLKPLNLIHLIHHHDYKVRSALVFTKSVESASRLVKLLELFELAYGGGVVIKGYTSEMKPGERKRVLAEFAEGKVHLLVCSDLITRGMDLPSVEHIVNYDIPLDMRKYIHRAGRTARAGRAGTAWSLVEKQETPHFKAMLRNANHEQRVERIKIKEVDLKSYQDSYEMALSQLKTLFARSE